MTIDRFGSTFRDTFGVPDPGSSDASAYDETYDDIYGRADVQPGAYSDYYTEYGRPIVEVFESRSQWTIWVRDEQYRRVSKVGRFTELKALMNYLSFHTWTLRLRYGDPAILPLLEQRAGIQIMFGSEIVLSGPSLGVLREWDNDTDAITFAGASDDVHLAWRNALPQPDTVPPWTSDAYQSIGAAEDVLLDLIDVNLGPGALPERRLSGLVMPISLHRGATLTKFARLETLQEAVADVCTRGGIGFRVIADRFGPHVEVFVARDKSREVVFSRGKRNLTNYAWALNAPKATHLYMLGDVNNGGVRPVVEADDAAAAARWWRIEAVADGRATDDLDLPTQALLALDDLAESYEVKISPKRDIEGARFIQDWKLGDVVTSELDGLATAETVRQVQLTIDKDGVNAIPAIAGPQQDLMLNEASDFVWSEIRRLDKKIRQVERQT